MGGTRWSFGCYVFHMRDIIAFWDRGFDTQAICGVINEQKPHEGEATYKLEKAPYYARRILIIPQVHR